MKRKQRVDRALGNPVPRSLAPASPAFLRYPTWSAAAVILAAVPACGERDAVEPVVEAPPAAPPVVLEPIQPASAGALIGAQLAVGDPCPLHEDGQVLADEPALADDPQPTKTPNIRPTQHVRHLAGRPVSVHRIATTRPGTWEEF